MEVSRSRPDHSRAAQNDLSAWNARPVEGRDILEPVEDAVARRVEIFRVPHDVAVVRLAGERDEAAVVERPHDFLVDVRHEFARRVDRREAKRHRLCAHGWRDAVRREDDSRVVRLRLFEIVHRGAVGSHLGSRHFRPVAIRRSLALVLLIAGAKLILTR
jgi:hypothetical protein